MIVTVQFPLPNGIGNCKDNGKGHGKGHDKVNCTGLGHYHGNGHAHGNDHVKCHAHGEFTAYKFLSRHDTCVSTTVTLFFTD